jgi:hypothetical protein
MTDPRTSPGVAPIAIRHADFLSPETDDVRQHTVNAECRQRQAEQSESRK